MSSRAACRLETLGFRRVYRYEAGKADWSANGLPVEGTETSIPTAGAAVRGGAPTCRLDDSVAGAAGRARSAGWDVCIVTTDEGIVLGRLRGDVLAAASPEPSFQICLSICFNPHPGRSPGATYNAFLYTQFRSQNLGTIASTRITPPSLYSFILIDRTSSSLFNSS